MDPNSGLLKYSDQSLNGFDEVPPNFREAAKWCAENGVSALSKDNPNAAFRYWAQQKAVSDAAYLPKESTTSDVRAYPTPAPPLSHEVKMDINGTYRRLYIERMNLRKEAVKKRRKLQKARGQR